MALRSSRQKQRRAQQISIGGGKGDIIDENVVQRSLCDRDFPRSVRAFSKCEFGFCRKGLSPVVETRSEVRKLLRHVRHKVRKQSR